MLHSFIFVFCGILLPVFLIVNGLRFGARQRFFYILHPIKATRDIISGRGGFKALSLALAGTLGIGNIVGVSSAIIMGGGGSVFWMIASAFIAMSIKYAETFFSVKYKKVKGGISFGGAPYYVREAFYGKRGVILALTFALLCMGNSLITGNLVQINGIKDIFPLSPTFIGLSFALFFLLVYSRGTEKISSVTAIIIPLLTSIHIVISLAIILSNFTHVPRVFANILCEAFNFKSALYGVGSYSILTAIRYGVSRGILSNEAGCGTSPIAHASSENPPHIQGCLGVFEVFFDTVVLCTLTALVILLYGESSLSPISLAFEAYGHYFGAFGKWFIKISCIIYAYSTVLSQFYYGDKSLSFISGNGIIHTLFALLYAFICFIAPFVPSDIMWIMSDINVSVLIFFNVTVLNFLYRKKDT